MEVWEIFMDLDLEILAENQLMLENEQMHLCKGIAENGNF